MEKIKQVANNLENIKNLTASQAEELFKIAKETDERKKVCPACGRDESYFTTTVTSPDGCGWATECKCGELIDED